MAGLFSLNPAAAGILGVTPRTPTTGGSNPLPPRISPNVLPPASTGPSIDDAISEWNKLTAAGQGEADKLFATGSLGTITDPRSVDMENYIKSLQGGAPLAAQEQGIANINKEMAGNQERIAGAAGGQGLAGGVSAALQSKQMSNANQSMSDYMRGLAINNQQQLGQALNQQQDRELAIETANNQLRNEEAYGRASYPIQYAASVMGLNNSNQANVLGQEGIKTQQDLIKQLATMFNANSNPAGVTTPLTPQQTAQFNAITSIPNLNKGVATTAVNSLPAATTPKQLQDIYNTASVESGGINYGSSAPGRATISSSGAPAPNPGASKGGTLTPPKGPFGTIICTEAHRQGFLTEGEFDISKTYGRHVMTSKELRAYRTWGRPIVALMQKSRTFAKVVAWFVHPMLRAEGACLNLWAMKDVSLRGRLTFKAFNAVTRFVMKLQAAKVIHARAE